MVPDEPFVAKFSLSSPEIEALAEGLPGVELGLVDHWTDAGGTDRAVVRIRDGDPAAVERALSASPLVETWAPLVVVPSLRLYEIAMGAGGALAALVGCSRDHRLVWETAAVRQGRVNVRAVAPSRAAFSAFRRDVRALGCEFDLERASSDLAAALTDGTAISAAQREAIVLAHRRGYFREPRAVTLAEIGEELDISPSAVSGRLRRGLARLVEDCLGADERAGETIGLP